MRYTGQGNDSGHGWKRAGWQEILPSYCEVKYFLPYWWARNVTAISDSSPPKVNESSLKGIQCLWSCRCCHTPWWLMRSWREAMQEAAIHHICHPLRWTGIKDINNQETRFGPRLLRCRGKEWIQWAQRLASFHTQRNARYLSLISGFPYLTIIFDVQTVYLFCWKLVYSLVPCPASLWNCEERKRNAC